MALLANLIFFLAIPAAIAAALAFVLASLAPGWSLRRRTVVAALISGALPMAIPVFGLVFTMGTEVDLLIPLAALVVAGLFVAAVIGLPVALIVGRRRSAVHPDQATFD